MNVHVTIDLSVAAQEKHWQEMRRAAVVLSDDPSSVKIDQPPDNLKRLIAKFTVPDAREGDVVDRIGKQFCYCMEDYQDSSIGFSRRARRRGRAVSRRPTTRP